MQSHNIDNLIPQRRYGQKKHLPGVLIGVVLLIIILLLIGYFLIRKRSSTEESNESKKEERSKQNESVKSLDKKKEDYLKKASSPLPAKSSEPIFNVKVLENFSNIIKIELLNGTKVVGVVGRLTPIVRRHAHGKIDILAVGNTHSPEYVYKESMVIDRIGNPEYAKVIADFFGIKRVITQGNKELLVDVTVIIGEDLINIYQNNVLWYQTIN
ncbi:MAG: LytR C-terminal domain-containing protein [Candidatus Coatesbacteria bacterium]|nr:LytR C-terminal domain-containing protein [Candidatus Coatesbacteria bacterium]